MHTQRPDVGASETVTVRYWAGARAAAGVDQESVDGVATVGDLTTRLLASRPGLAAVLPVCTVLVEGLASGPEAVLPAGAVVEVLPPFAGG
ncbi:MoaD/ThiS family protein [Oryzobacter telluris]|jgi:molybdopterin converting factor small subunit|uniref:MoaD/ThiS family protein n=1 Tax=Oryzobacter telluris TaxID=3149179 RepID=UPI00370D1768